MRFETLLDSVKAYYDNKIEIYGPTPRGVDWNTKESQIIRFEQLLKVCHLDQRFTLNDYGCGYGALASYLIQEGFEFQYFGFDISEDMARHAAFLHQGFDNCQFFSSEALLRMADYTVASGIFNVKLQTSSEEWEEYILHILRRLNDISTRGFSYNMLTSYAENHLMRDDLYYGDPGFYFDYCKRHFSKYVALLHDYPLYEFTIQVTKEGSNL